MNDRVIGPTEPYIEGYNILVVPFINQKLLTTTFFRLQEYYESPHWWIRGRKFSVEEFIYTHLSDAGNIEYFNFWSGFNVPSHIVNEFFSLYAPDELTFNERLLKCTIDTAFDGRDDKTFYLIGVLAGDKETLNHEIIHAKYHSNSAYRNQVNEIIVGMPNAGYALLSNHLRSMGYCEDVINDEINAYLGTSKEKWLRIEFDVEDDITWKKNIKPTFLKLRRLAKIMLEKDDINDHQ